MDLPFAEQVDVLTAAKVLDPKSGKPTADDWDAATSESYNVAVAPGGSMEQLQVGRDEVDSDFDLYFPADAEVTSSNRVVVRDQVCDVVGRPFSYVSPFTGWAPGTVVQAKLREG